jgi:hypothetical protein
MSKRKLDKIDGHDPWEVEVAYCINELKVEPIDARAIVIISWMYRGDLRPLAAALRDGPLDPPVLSQFLRMIDQDLLTVKRKRGAPTQPSKSVRDLVIAFRHANREGKSADAIQALAEQFGISDELVRRAIRRRPKLTN